MWEILSFAVTVASECLGGLVRPHCGYVFFADRKVSQLDGELEELVNTREMVRRSVEEARDDTKPIFPFVDKWLVDEQIVANRARGVLDGRAQKTCCYGWLPNPKARYRLGKDASKTVEEIQKLIARRNTWEKVYYENPPPGLVGGAADLNSSAADGGDIITGSRACIFQDIMEALGDDKLKVIGVYGPGGVGKTTLLKEVKEKLGKEKKPFQMIVKAEVSQTPDLDNIRKQIADYLRLDLGQKQSPQGRRDLLLERLQRDPKEKILVILDNLWKELDLEAIGIPNGDESRGCKLLLTSRYKGVLERKMHADRTFRLEGLNNDEAFRLFEKKVGDKLKDEEELKQIATQVVKKLAGLPLLIISVARTLKYSDAPAWRNALIKIEESNVETIVKLAYDHLKKEDAQSLFLLCGLISGTIQVEILLILGMGLGLFEGFNKTMKDARDRLDNMLNELRSACLLLDGGDDKRYVTIHDLYSEVVVSTPFRGQNYLMMNNNYGSWSKKKLEKCWAICLMDDGSDRLAELMQCGFPNLKILMLSQPRHWSWHGRPEHLLDFTYMKELQVLYLDSMRITTLPPSIEMLGNLQSLCLDCCDVKDVAILGKLKALQILSLARSTISRLPKEIGDLTNLKSLNLSNCWNLKIIEPGVLKGLINLEELLMRLSFCQWMGNDEGPSESRNAKLAELKSLTRLTALEISIPDPTIFLEDGELPFGNLIRFRIHIGNVSEFYEEDFDGLRTRKLKLEDCDSILSKEWVQKILSKTEYLDLDGLGVIDLEKLWNGPVTPDCFSKLKVVHIVKCHRLKNLWFLSEMQRLVHLEEIEVRECDSLQAIITDDGGKVEVAADDRVVLPNVRRLVLSYLPNMTSFCTGADGAPIQVSLPNLEELSLVAVTSLKRICHSELAICPSLKSLFDCGSLDPNTEQTRVLLPKLESVSVQRCTSLESLFDCGSLDSNMEQTIVLLPKLKLLMVEEAHKLRHVVQSDSQTVWAFPSLKIVHVRFCSELRYLFPDFTAATLEELEELEIHHCQQMKEVVRKEGGGQSKADVMSFPSLAHVIIQRCHNFGAFIPSPTSVQRKLGETAEENDESPQPLFNEMVKLPNITSLRIEDASCKELWNNQIPDNSFCKLEFLQLKHCDNLQCIAPSHMWKRLQCRLDILQVESCGSIEIIYEGNKTATKSGTLRRLVLRDLENLRHIWQSNGLPNVPLSLLRFIKVQSCPHLRVLFPTFTPEFLRQIKELEVASCEDMELIAGHEEREEAIGTAITFSELTALTLINLPKFESFLPQKYSVKSPSLQVLRRVSCGTEPDQCRGDWERYRLHRDNEISKETQKYRCSI